MCGEYRRDKVDFGANAGPGQTVRQAVSPEGWTGRQICRIFSALLPGGGLTAAAIASWFGGASTPRLSDADILHAIENGLPISAFDSLVRAGRLTAEEADRIVLPRRTLAYRRKHRQRLSVDESDRLARVARTTARAESTFGSQERAALWLRQPNRALGRRAPLDLLVTGEGALIVESVLVRIDDGVYE